MSINLNYVAWENRLSKKDRLCVKLSFSRRIENLLVLKYRKIPKISPGAYIFQRPFLRGLFSEGIIYGGKFAFQNRLG